MKPMIAVQKFWTEYKANKTNPKEMIGIDMVAYGPVGQLDRTINISKVSTLFNIMPLQGNEQNPAVAMAHARRDAIKPRYDAWKIGNELPIQGTPLAAWNGVTPEQAEILKASNIRTVEEIAELNDATRARIPLPGLQDLIGSAKRYVASSDFVQYQKALADKDEQIKRLELQGESHKEDMDEMRGAMAEMRNMLAAMQAQPVGEAPPPRRGRSAAQAVA